MSKDTHFGRLARGDVMTVVPFPSRSVSGPQTRITAPVGKIPVEAVGDAEFYQHTVSLRRGVGKVERIVRDIAWLSLACALSIFTGALIAWSQM